MLAIGITLVLRNAWADPVALVIGSALPFAAAVLGAWIGELVQGSTIETEDCRKTFEELKSRGVRFETDVLEYPWGYVALFEDPDGNRLQIREGRTVDGLAVRDARGVFDAAVPAVGEREAVRVLLAGHGGGSTSAGGRPSP